MSLLAFLRVPAVLLNSAAVVATAISMGYYSATLEPHLRMVGTTYFLLFAVYNSNNKDKPPVFERLPIVHCE